MKKYLCLFLCLVFTVCSFLTPAYAAVTKKVNDLGEIEYASKWRYGVFEEVSFEKYQVKKGLDEWGYMLQIKVVKPRKLSIEPAQLIFNKWHYDVDTFYTGDSNWRPYILGHQSPKEKNQLILDIYNENRLRIKVLLVDGRYESIELPQYILQEWKSIIKSR